MKRCPDLHLHPVLTWAEWPHSPGAGKAFCRNSLCTDARRCLYQILQALNRTLTAKHVAGSPGLLIPSLDGGMPGRCGQANTQRALAARQPRPENVVGEFATSNSTSSHFLGTPQRSWMNGMGGVASGATGRANVASYAPPTDVVGSSVNQHVPHLHSPSTTRVEKEGEVNTTRRNVLGDRSTFTAPRPSPTTIRTSNPQNRIPSPPVPQSTLDPAHSRGLAQDSNTGAFDPWTSNPSHQSVPQSWTESGSAAAAPVTTETLRPSSSATLRQFSLPDLPHRQTTPHADWYTWQTAEAPRFSAVRTTSSPTMVSAANQPQPFRQVTTQAPPAMNPSPAQAPGTASRKRAQEAVDESRRTRSRSDGPTVAQIPTPLATPIDPAQPYLISLLRESVGRLRQQQPLIHLDEQRFSLLTEACQSNDMIYVMIHQIYCTSSVDSGFLASLAFSDAEVQGLAMLEPVLVPNDRLTRGALVLAINFPQHPYRLFEPASAQTLASVRTFLRAMATRWDMLRNTCKARGYPPSTIELAYECSLRSATMQKTLFSSMQRQVGPSDHLEFRQGALELFLQDQLQFWRQPAALTRDLALQDGRRFGQRYLYLRGFYSDTQAPGAQQRGAQAQSPINAAFSPNQRHLRIHQAAQPLRSLAFQSNPTHQVVAAPPATVLGHPNHNNACNVTLQRPNNGPPFGAPGGSATRPSRHTATAAVSSSRPFVPNAPHQQPAATANGKPSTDFRLLPPIGYPVPYSTHSNPDRVALHQAHLRSPIPRKLDLRGNDTPDLRLYQYVKDFVLEPQRLDANAKFKEWNFNIDQADFEHKVHDVPALESLLKCDRLYKAGAYLFRLKAIARSVNLPEPLHPSEFHVSPTSWPHSCFVSVNDCHDVEFRREQHYARDLPADLTPLVRSGHNQMQLSNHSITEGLKKVYFFAVERIHVIDHAAISNMPLKLRANASLVSIASALKASQDDEISFAEPFISIDLVDPFMATIWRTPVRSMRCKHKECFDLQAFLLSRTSKVKDGPMNPDQWMCPICKRDARPHKLMIDGFLVEVRTELEAKGQLDARAILVKQDGSWEAKFDKDKKDPPSGKQTPGPGLVANGQQVPGLEVDLDGMPGGEINGDAKDTPQATTSGSATPMVGPAAQMRTPNAATTIIEIDDNE